MFTFEQPADVSPHQPAPAASVVSAVNYDRSPSLVDPSAVVDTPIKQMTFESFEQAAAVYEHWLPSCNWVKPPSLKRFWYESERHTLPAEVDYITWSYRAHPLWAAANNGDIVPREAGQPGKGPVLEGSAEVQSEVAKPSIAPEAAAALERSAKIAEQPAIDRGPSVVNEALIDSAPPSSYAEAFDRAEAKVMAITREEAAKQTAELAAEIIADDITDEPAKQPTAEEAAAIAATSTAIEEHTAANGKPPIVVTTEVKPIVRRKYTEAEYADLRRIAEENFAIELQRRENLYSELSMERAKQEDRVKALKAEERATLDSLRLFIADGPKYPKNPEIKEEPPKVEGQASQGGGQPAAAASSSDPAPAASSELDVSDERYERYRALPLLPIVRDIKGLGSAKLTALVDGYPSVGKLLDLQKEKGIFWFKELGKGFGPELGNRIADAVADALTKVE